MAAVPAERILRPEPNAQAVPQNGDEAILAEVIHDMSGNWAERRRFDKFSSQVQQAIYDLTQDVDMRKRAEQDALEAEGLRAQLINTFGDDAKKLIG